MLLEQRRAKENSIQQRCSLERRWCSNSQMQSVLHSPSWVATCVTDFRGHRVRTCLGARTRRVITQRAKNTERNRSRERGLMPACEKNYKFQAASRPLISYGQFVFFLLSQFQLRPSGSASCWLRDGSDLQFNCPWRLRVLPVARVTTYCLLLNLDV